MGMNTGKPEKEKGKLTMNKTERIKTVKAMEYLARQLNDESIFCDLWLTYGVADGDIDFGDLSVSSDDLENLEYYTEDEPFSDLMRLFLIVMAKARKSGGLFSDGVVSKE